jgi:hypothetical protein
VHSGELNFGVKVTGSLALNQLTTPGTTQKTNKLANWLVVYRTVSLSLGVIVTSSIIARLLYVHRRMGSVFRSPRSPYLGVVAMLVESASLDTVSTLVYIVTVGINSPLQNVFLPILGQVQVSSSIVALINPQIQLIESAGDRTYVDSLSRRTWPGCGD